MNKKIKLILIIILIPVVLFLIFLTYAILNDYKPEPIEILYESKTPSILNDTIEYNLMTWNLGYCGLGSDMDFFYDEGKQVFTTKERYLENLNKISQFIKNQSTKIDFFLLQEVDLNSKRSFRINQMDTLNACLPKFKSFFGKNYEVFFVPTPILKPYGKVLGGLVSYSIYEPISVKRFSFPGTYSFPVQLFMLDRCFMEKRFKLQNGKELLIINTHNEAYDDGSQRKEQMAFLKDYIVSEYKKGNYILIGGDWNQCAPKFEPNFDGYLMDNVDLMYIPEDYLPEWKWISQNKVPTNRRLQFPFDKTKSVTTVIDFFLVSPNIEAVGIQAIDLEFENSDHNPVITTIKLLNN